MTKHAKKSDHLQAVDLSKMMAVEIPLPLLEVFANIDRPFLELCIDARQPSTAVIMFLGLAGLAVSNRRIRS